MTRTSGVVGRTPTLEESYAECRRLNRASGTTYYWAAQVLPKVKRHHVHALYGFCRYADDIVDDMGPAPTQQRGDALDGGVEVSVVLRLRSRQEVRLLPDV